MSGFYVQDVKEVNGCQIKERYGEGFEKARRVEKLPKYIVVVSGWSIGDFTTLKIAEGFCKRLTPMMKAAPALYEAALKVIACWERGDLASAVRQLNEAVNIVKGEE